MDQCVGFEVDQRVDVVGGEDADRLRKAADLADVTADLVGLLTPTPTSSKYGCFTISAITILPTKPVPHTTIRLSSITFHLFPRCPLVVGGDRLRQPSDVFAQLVDLRRRRRLIRGVLLGDALHDP